MNIMLQTVQTINSKNIKYDYPKECEIWLANLGKGEGHQQYGIRPVLVHSNNVNNKFSPMINVFAITSKINKVTPVHVLVHPTNNNGLKEDSMILVEQNITIDKTKLIHKMGIIDDVKMREVDEKIVIQTPSLSRYIQSLLKN